MKHDFLTRMREIFAHFLSKLNEDTCHYINGPETLPPPLTKAEEQVVFQNIRDGKPNARDPLITHNLRLVVYIAKKFESPAVNVEDLISIGTIGLIKAVNTFSVERNIKLATYASRCIENEILMYLRKTAQLKNEISLDDPLNVDWDGNELLLSDLLGSDPDIVNRGIEQESEKQTLLRAVEKLDPREKQIMELRFGLNRQKEHTQKEVADALGISQSYISRLEKRILHRLKTEMEKAGDKHDKKQMYLPILVTHLLFLKNTPVLKYSVYTSFKYLTPYGGSSTLPWMSLVSPVKRSTALYSPRASMEHGAFSALTATNTVS